MAFPTKCAAIKENNKEDALRDLRRIFFCKSIRQFSSIFDKPVIEYKTDMFER